MLYFAETSVFNIRISTIYRARSFEFGYVRFWEPKEISSFVDKELNSSDNLPRRDLVFAEERSICALSNDRTDLI